LNSRPEAPKNWWQYNSYLNDSNYGLRQISRQFWIVDITDWWHQHEEMHSEWADLPDTARDTFRNQLHYIEVESSISLQHDVICRWQSETTGDTLREQVIVREFAAAKNGISAGNDSALDRTNTGNDSEMNKKAEETTLHRMAKAHYFLEMWQGSQHQFATQQKSCAQNNQMTARGYISDMEEIIKASWSLFQHDGEAAFKLSERSPMPPALSAKDLPGGQTQIFKVHRIGRIKRHTVHSEEDSATHGISDTADWLNGKGDLDYPNDSEDDCGSDFESDIEQGNTIEDPECPEQLDVSATLNVPGLIRPMQIQWDRLMRCWLRLMQ